MPRLKAKLPPVYQSFFPDFIEKNVPEEKWATCSNCTRCRSPKSPYIDTKCCDYYPYLANYLVGGILLDKRPEMAEGQKRVRELIRQKAGVTPYGILPPQAYRAKWKKRQGEPVFGVSSTLSSNREEAVALRCPYLNEGNCTVWDYRENLCSTHFCVSIGGKIGKGFWKNVNNYLKMAENALSTYALYEAGIPASRVNTSPIKSIDFRLEKEDGEIDRERYEHLWGHWKGREEDLYRQCYEIVAGLDKQTFVELCGHRQIILAEAMQESLDSFIDNTIPDYLILHPDLEVVQDSISECILRLGIHSVSVNPVVYIYLKMFNGKRNTKEIIDQSYLIYLSLIPTIDELISKNMLVPVAVSRVAV